MERNVELLQQTMQAIKDHPELHNQGWWFTAMECGTAACFAGWAATLKGWSSVSAFTQKPGDGRCVSGVIRKGEEGGHVRMVAERELGLTGDEADALFDGDNTVEMLELMVKDLVNGDKLKPRWHYRQE